MEDGSLWSLLCNYSDQGSSEAGKKRGYGFLAIEDSSSCVTRVLSISVDVLFLAVLLCFFIYKSFSRKVVVMFIMPSKSQHVSPLVLFSVIFNGVLGLAYLGCGVLMVVEKLRTEQTILPLHGWLATILQGFTWLPLGLAISFQKLSLPGTRIERLCSVMAFLFAGFLFTSSIWEAIVYKVVSVSMILDVLSLPGAILFLFCSFSGHNDVEADDRDFNATGSTRAFYSPLQDEEEASNVTPYATAGFLSTMSFWWLNPLMKEGKKKALEVEDVPQLRHQDRAKTCYLTFMEELSKRTQDGSSDPPSLLSVIVSCHWRAILITGFFALIKVLALSTGPLLLMAFINASEGKTTFKHEGYVLALGLFTEKCLESLSERQWFFRTRLMGLQVRSLLSAAVYKKQLCLSNAAQMDHSAGEIMSYVTVDASRIGEFPYWFHQIWSTTLQLSLSLVIVYYSIGLATFGAFLSLILTMLVSFPLGKLQHKYQTKLMSCQDRRLKAIMEALANMKVLKLYAWETHFKNIIGQLRKEESQWILSVLTQKGHYSGLFWSSPLLVSAVTIWVCYFLGITLNASNLFTFLACLRLAQQPIRMIPDVAGVFIEAMVSLHRIEKFLKAPELENRYKRQTRNGVESNHSIFISCDEISWETSSVKATLRNINLVVSPGEKVAICGEVGSGKSTLLAAILGEVPHTSGTVLVHGKIAYVSQTGWIQSGTIQENILFGSVMDQTRYQEVLEKCSLTKDLSMLPFGDLTQLGERGVNLSGGQKQRVQLARALYQNADVYLLDDPFSAVDAHTATSLFNGYVMEALAGKTVLLVTHQVDFLPAFNSVLLMSAGEISRAASHDQLLESSTEFQNLVNAHNKIAGSGRSVGDTSTKRPETFKEVIQTTHNVPHSGAALGDQLIKQEEKEEGDTGLKPYIQYINQDKGLFFFSLAFVLHILFVGGQLIQNYWLAAEIDGTYVSKLKLITVYSLMGCVLSIILFSRSTSTTLLGFRVSKAMFSTLMTSLFRAPMSFYDSTPLGRILSRVSSDLSIIDVNIAIQLSISIGSTMNTCAVLVVLGIITWPVLFVIIPMIFQCIFLQRYYFASAKEFMRMNGTTKSLVTGHVSESIAGVMTIRAFGEEERFLEKALDLIDVNASTYFHSFSANQWLIQRLEILCAVVLSSSALAMTLLELGASASGFAGMALAYGLSLNTFLVTSVQQQCLLENSIISVERMEQFMHLPSEAPEVIEDSRPSENWPSVGKVEICDLKVRYRLNAPLVLRGISCTIEGGHKVGIVGRTGSGKTTLISVLFRLVEPTQGKIMVDGLDISTIGLHDLRSRFGIIPQEPTLFSGSVRYNLDPLSEHTDMELWEVLRKCQLHEAIEDKERGLDSIVAEDGSNWSMGQRQLFCLGRALLKRSRILVLDEATASIDNATDSVLQKTIRTEFADCTVITVAHRVPTVMDCDMVLSISDGNVVEYEEPMKLIEQEGSLFRQLYEEYWSRGTNDT